MATQISKYKLQAQAAAKEAYDKAYTTSLAKSARSIVDQISASDPIYGQAQEALNNLKLGCI